MDSQTNNLSNCYLCGSSNTKDFFELPPIPTMDGVMCKTKEEALAVTKGQISLRFCKHCGYIGNEGHVAEKISFNEYDFSNVHSPTFAQNISDLCERLIDNYDLQKKTILDIGCGDGYFLKAICKKGENNGIGIDPGFDHSSFKKNGIDLTFYREYYSEKHAALKADLVTSLLVISVLNDPKSFISLIRKNFGDQTDTIFYFDFPYADYTFGERVIWNVVYEHRSWFSKASLRFLMEQCGFEVLDIGLSWNDEYIYVEARPDPKYSPASASAIEVEKLETIIESFSSSFKEIMANNERKIEQISAKNKRVIAWGAGARGVSFFNCKIRPY